MVKQLSCLIAGRVGRQLNYDQSQIEILAYGAEIVVGYIVGTAILIALSLILGIFKPTLLVLIAWGTIRIKGGGAHEKTFLRCQAVGAITILVLAKLSTYTLPLSYQWAVFALIVMSLIIAIIKWVPAGTEKKRITDPVIRFRQKIYTAIIGGIWLASIIWLSYSGEHAAARALTYGAAGAVFAINPAGYQAIALLDRCLDHLLERRF